MADYFPQQQAPSLISGQLPFGQGGGDMFSQDLGTAYKSAYSSALAQNQANYSNILTGYRQTLADQGQAQDAIGRGYVGLYSDVMGRIQGIDQSQRQAISDSYTAQQGQAQQSMISRGLGNATVSDSVQRGLFLDQQKANIALSNQTAQLQAGYAGQIGGAALNYGNQAAMQNTALQAQQLGFMTSVNAPYPNAAAYAQLLQQQGMIGQANQDRAMQQSQFEQMMQAARSAQGGVGGGGFQTRNTPAPPLSPMNPGGSPGYASSGVGIPQGFVPSPVPTLSSWDSAGQTSLNGIFNAAGRMGAGGNYNDFGGSGGDYGGSLNPASYLNDPYGVGAAANAAAGAGAAGAGAGGWNFFGWGE